MTTRDDAREKLRRVPKSERTGEHEVAFVACGGPLQNRWEQALSELEDCLSPGAPEARVLYEGGVYHGTWLESTGTINTEVLARFRPNIATSTLLLFAQHQREDGMLPYKVTPEGPAYSQIQIVTPLARVVWNHYRLNELDHRFLRTMYSAMVRYDDWIERYRNTRGTGGVEAFCTFDTGHDLSPRFWFAPDRALGADARYCDPTAPLVPYVAPDLTANIACQRHYLGVIAAELGEPENPWQAKAESSIAALYAECYDEADGFFYDSDRNGRAVLVQSDVLLRVLACEIGDGKYFEQSLRRYLMNTRKFLAHYGLTSIALDDPRFDHDAGRNSWGGPVNFLALLRAPAAFEHHGHLAEWNTIASPVLAALARSDRFPQCLDPRSGEAGFTEVYSPAILWFIDEIERSTGILPRPDGELWFSAATPSRLEHGTAAEAVAYRRRIDGVLWESAGDDVATDIYRDGAWFAQVPRGWRLITDRRGGIQAVVGLSPATVSGSLLTEAGAVELAIEPNECVELAGVAVLSRRSADFVAPVFD